MLARLRADVPSVLGGVTSGWALPCLPYTGDGSGLHVVPPVGAGVWIEFEAGDPDYPVWTGGWWGSGQPPTEETGRPARPSLKVLRSEEGLVIALDDDDQTIAVSDGNGRNLVEIQVRRGEVRVQAQSRVIVEAPLIDLVENASHPIVFGDSLLQYLNQLVALFNAHLHVGETAAGILPVTPAPPATPYPPANPSLLSTKVKSG
jgi:uncharacterized protein involved in type VI secretion and phage assembly